MCVWSSSVVHQIVLSVKINMNNSQCTYKEFHQNKHTVAVHLVTEIYECVQAERLDTVPICGVYYRVNFTEKKTTINKKCIFLWEIYLHLRKANIKLSQKCKRLQTI
jgi:hypothetical protein